MNDFQNPRGNYEKYHDITTFKHKSEFISIIQNWYNRASIYGTALKDHVSETENENERLSKSSEKE